MKQLELSLQKRLLIVDIPDELEANYKLGIIYSINGSNAKYALLPKGNFEFICKGPKLTEDIAKDFFNYEQKFDNFNRFIEGYRYGCALHHTSLSAFKSAIEERGHYWGENPYKDPYTQIEIYGNNSPETTTNYQNDLEKFQKAESRTFHLEKTQIFEIL